MSDACSMCQTAALLLGVTRKEKLKRFIVQEDGKVPKAISYERTCTSVKVTQCK